MVEVVDVESEKKKENVNNLSFEIQEYEFSEVQEVSSDKFRSKINLYDKYKKDKDISSKDSFKLYSEVRNISNKDVSLLTIKDHDRDTLNLAVAPKNRIHDMRLNL